MKTKAVLFDLDGTLIDTRNLDGLRQRRRWRECVAALGRTVCFDGIPELLADLASRDIKVGIVTTSVSYYAEAACAYHQLRYDTLVAFHDAIPKPAPDPFLRALDDLSVAEDAAIGVGDGLPDSQALAVTRILALGAGWSPTLDDEASWDGMLSTPAQLLDVIESRE